MTVGGIVNDAGARSGKWNIFRRRGSVVLRCGNRNPFRVPLRGTASNADEDIGAPEGL
jgi:hypothetical protein